MCMSILSMRSFVWKARARGRKMQKSVGVMSSEELMLE